MSIFIAVLGGIALFAFAAASVVVPIVIWLDGPSMDWKTPLKLKLAATAGGVLLLAVALTIFIGWVASTPDNASHCGAGTHYVSETHYIGKTVYIEWSCVAA